VENNREILAINSLGSYGHTSSLFLERSRMDYHIALLVAFWGMIVRGESTASYGRRRARRPSTRRLSAAAKNYTRKQSGLRAVG
jgi:hypothetical protein